MPWGSIIGGALSFLGARSARREQRRAEDRAWARYVQQDNTKIQRLVSDAAKAGVHPLAALGASVAGPQLSGAGVMSGGDISGAMGGIGQGIGDLISGKLDTEKSLAEAQVRNLEADTMEKMARSRTLLSETKRRTQAASTGAVFGPPDPGYWITPSGRQVTIGVGTASGPLSEEYGELAGEIPGVIRLQRDLTRDADYRRAVRRTAERARTRNWIYQDRRYNDASP